MSWRLGILAAVLTWLFLASPAVLAAAERADSGIEIRNGTRTQNLAHLTRTLLSLQGFNVVQIGNYIDFGVEATVIYYRAEAEKVARALQSEIFPGASIEASSRLKDGVDIKVLLGSDLLAQPRMMARLLGEESAASQPAIKTSAPESGSPPRSTAAKGTAVPVIAGAPATAEPNRPPSQSPPPAPTAAAAAKSGAIQRPSDSRISLAAAERATSGIEIRNGTRTQNLAHLTRTLLSLQGFNVVQIGNYIDFGVEATVIYYRTEAEKVAKALQSEIFPGARIEASASLKNGIDIKVLLGSDLLAQPRMMARLLGKDLTVPPPAVKAPTPESGSPPRSTAAKGMTAPVVVNAPATIEPAQPPSQAPPPAAAAAESAAIQRPPDSRISLAATERATSGIEVRNGTRTQNLAHLTRTLLSLQGFNVVQIGNYIDFGAEATVIYYRTGAEKVARALQSEIFPGARLEESSRLQNGVDLKVLLGSDLLAQPRMMARLFEEEMAASPPAVKAPTPELEPPSRSAAAKAMPAPVVVNAPATIEPAQPPSQAPPPAPAAAAPDPGPSQRQAVLAAVVAEREASGNEVRHGTGTHDLVHLTQTLLSQPDFNVVQLGNQINSGMAGTVIHCKTEAEKAARGLQSEIFPGARLEESSGLKNGVDLKVLLGHDLLAELAAPPPAPLAAESGANQGPTDRRDALDAAEEANSGIEVRNGNQIDSGAAATVIHCRTEAEKVARALQSEIFPGASLEESSGLKNGVDLKVLLGHDLLGAQPLMLARLLGEERTVPPMPAAAAESGAIQLHTDSRGVLHIGNVPPSQPRPSQPDRPSVVPEAMIAEPRRSRSRQVRLVGQNEETYTPESHQDAIQKACQGLAQGVTPAHEFDGVLAAARQAAAEKEAVEVAGDYNYLPVRQVSQDQGVIPVPAPQSAAPTIVEPAAAGDIRRYRDARGVLHIGNVPPSQPRPSQPDRPSVVREAMIAEPRRSRSRQVRLVGQTEETYTPESHLDAIRKACQDLAQGEAPAHEFDGVIAAAAQAGAEKEAAEVEVDYNYLPVRQVSRDQGVIPAPAPQSAAPTIVEPAATGDIRRYRDARGVLHLSNAAPGAEDLGPGVQMAQSRNNQGGEAGELGQPAATLPRLPFRQALWNPDDPRLATLPTTSSPVKQTAPGSSSPIWEYRDSKRVIHISNVDPEPREVPQPAGLMAGNSAAAGFEPQARRPLPASIETAGGLAWRPAAWNGEDGIKPLKRVKAAPSQTAEVITDGGIRRYRDKKGIIHIKTVEYPLPPGVVLPSRQASPNSMAPMAAAPPAPAVSNLPGSATSALPVNPTTLNGARARITAFKDAKGRLRITTELPPPVPGKLPPMPVYAALEPIILEAAQIHRLPPTLIKAVIKAESNFCSWAVSPKGAMGLMQLMPGTADFLGVREPFNPRENILGGCHYLRMLIDLFGGNLPLALASYNAGFQRVIDCGYQIPAIKETQNFVTTVMGRYVAEEKRGRQPS